MISAQTLKRQYKDELRMFGLDAPFAMLQWLQMAEQSEDEACKRLTAAITAEIADLAMTQFRIRRGRSQKTETVARENTERRVRNMIIMAALAERADIGGVNDDDPDEDWTE